MKKLNLLIYYILFIVYEELVFSCIIFKTFPASFGLIILFSIPIAIVLNLITSVFKPKVNKIITYIITIALIIIFGAQIVYYSMYEAIISFFSMMHGGQVTEFMEVIIDVVLRNWYGILLFIIPLIILIILSKKKVITFEKNSIKQIAIKITSVLIIQLIALLCVNFINTDDMYSNKNLYYNIHVPKVTANRMGLLTTMRLDLQRFIFGFEEKLSVQTNAIPKEEEKDSYNITYIDFDKLIKNEEDNTIKEMHEYFSSQEASKKNKYTGMFKDKNLIVLVGESFSSLAIREDLTPNLYKLYKEGFQFDNFYTPIFPVSTADGEYITDTSLIPKEGVWSFLRVAGNYMPYSYANVFEKQGYSSNAYHNHTATYYERDKYIETMGYNSYLAVGTGLEDRMDTSNWPNSDYEMVKTTVDDYINNEKFMAYYMTVSGHMNYTKIGNMMVYRNWDQVKDLPYSNKAKGYLAANIELDKAVGELLSRLEQAGKLEDTVIVISGDHYPYGLTLGEINELSTFERDDKFEKFRMPFLIWSGSMKGPIKVEKIGSSLDVLPTVLNLFGAEFDSRLLMGRDILSDSDPIVIFSDRSFITDKGRYNSLTEQFTPNEGVTVEEGYVDKINTIIYKKYQMSRLILENDYYKHVFKTEN
ncbi:sulfatase [Clostridium sp. CAG:452]|jgi:lipoteichoic acid synthase|nr:sulfatase [Clostridium sp. CAG:452]